MPQMLPVYWWGVFMMVTSSILLVVSILHFELGLIGEDLKSPLKGWSKKRSIL